MTFNAGSAMVTLDGDAKGAVEAFKRAADATAVFEARTRTAADAAIRATSRVDELRAKQVALASALAAAGAATERDEGKVHALRLELEQTTGALNRLTGAQQVSVSVQQKITAATTSMTASVSTATTSHRNMGGAVLEASRAFEDMQYGIAGVLNNIPSLVMGLGGTMGLAGVLSLVLVAVTQLTRFWPDFGAAAKSAIAEAAESAKTLRGEIADLEKDLLRLTLGNDRATLHIQGQAVVAAATAAAPGLEKVGGRERFDRLVGYEAQGTSIDSVTSLSALEWTALKAAVEKADLELSKLAAIKRVQNEQADQARIDAAVDAANASEAAHQAAQKAAAAAAEKELNKSQEYDLVASMFADVKAAGTKSTASWANPTITPEGASELAAMQSDAEKASVVISAAAYATADEIEKMNADFVSAGEAAKDLRTPLERFADALRTVDFGDVATATAKGGLSAGGVAAGTAIGGVVDAATGGATGGLGAIVGGILGGILGRLLDQLISVLGVLTPVFDALAIVIGALSPIFMVLSVLMTSVAGVVVSLVPILAALAEPIAALLLVAVRIVQALLPFVSILLLGVGVIVAFLEVITIGIQWLDTNFFRPAASGAAALYNGFVSVYNAFIDFIRTIPGFDEFGVKMESMSTYVEDTIGGFATSLGDIKDVMGDTADETAKVGRSMSNVPSWYRVPLAEYRAAGGTGGSGASGASNGGSQQVFNGPVTFVMTTPNISETVRKGLMRMRGTPVGGARRGNEDDSN